MSVERADRLAAAARLADFLSQSDAQAMFDENGYKTGQEVVLVFESDTLRDCHDRLDRYEPPVVFAIYWPQQDDFEFISVRPGSSPLVEQMGDVDPNTTIGMFSQYLDAIFENSGKVGAAFRLTAWAAPMEVAGFHLAK